VCESESRASFHDGQPSIPRNVNWGLFPPQQNQPSLSEPKAIATRSRPTHWVAFFAIARLPEAAETISLRGMRLPRTFQMLAMTVENSLVG
jgi:hypothetical protein